MVLGRNDKRKRKEGDLVDLMDPTSGTPKRAKVHAQRKFAQGVATVFSPVPPLLKEKEQRPRSTMVTELITHKRPNTEDFLTFLCFRGTSILPPSLNFFNQGNKKEKGDPKAARSRSSAGPVASSTQSTPPPPSNQAKGESNSNNNTNNNNNNDNSRTQSSKPAASAPASTTKKKFPNVIHKTVTVSKFKTATSTIQALKKKYKEQRLAKQRIENKFKTSVMRTRSAASRALLKPSNKILHRIEKKSLCLRSSGAVVEKSKMMASKSGKLLPKTKKKIGMKRRAAERSESSSGGSISDDNPSEKEAPKRGVKLRTGPVKQAARGGNVKSKVVLAAAKKKPELTRRVTRSRSETAQNTVPTNQRPSRKTKEAAAVYMEILSRKLVSPDLENDDNMSLESFPEVPSARRDSITAKNMENEKKKKLMKKKTAENINVKDKNVKGTLQKTALRVRKCVKASRDSDSDDNTSIASEKSQKVGNMKTRAITRRNSGLHQVQPLNRNLRSSRSAYQKIEKNKLNTQANVINKEKKINIKRKNDDLSTRETAENREIKEAEKKDKRLRKKANDNGESDEEPLGKVLNRIKKDKLSKPLILGKRNTQINSKTSEIKKNESSEPVIMIKKINKIGIDNVAKVSDDEGSFRGFSKKSIKSVTNSSSVNDNDLSGVNDSKETDSKLDLLKNYEKNKLEGKNENLKVMSTSGVKGKVSAVTDNKIIIPQFFPKNLVTMSSTTTLPSSSLTINEKMQNIIGVPSTKLISRKERVNMSAEEIEKWLDESLLLNEESKAEMETVTNFSYGIEPEKTKLDNSTSCHLSIPTRIQHLVRPVNVAIAKMADKQFNTVENSQSMDNHMKTDIIVSSTGIAVAKPIIPTNRNKINADIKEIIKGRTGKNVLELASDKNVQGTVQATVQGTVPAAIDQNEMTLKSVTDDSDTSPSSITEKLTKKKAQPQQQRKTFLSKTKERKLSTPNSNAFSPENESSVYAFESETETPVSTPFRRKIRDNKLDTPEKNEEKGEKGTSGGVNVNTCTATNTTNNVKEQDKSANSSIEGLRAKAAIKNLPNAKILRFDNIPVGWNNLSCGNSIAVQVNFDDSQESHEINANPRENNDSGGNHDKNDDKNCDNNTSTEISTQTDNANDNEDDGNTHVFYIPFETVGRNISHLSALQGQSLIQGVAVKLGTEGASGPNQRVLLRAQLVTKPPITVTRCPPVGTVQPTTRTPQNTLDPNSVPSTSSSAGSSAAATVTATASQASLQTRSSGCGTDPPPEKPKKPVKTVSRVKKLPASDSPSPIKAAEKEKRRPAKKVKKTSISSSETEQSSMNQDAHSSLMSSSSITNDKSEARLADAPTFHPTEKDFQDPLEYIEKIRPIAEKYGICKVVPPPNFKPECKVSDDMRFTAYNQYVHRMLHRWGPNVKEMMAIKKYLATQSITLSQPPWIGGMEVDLPHLYQTVQSLGGLKEVIEKKKWQKVADGMKIPKSAQDRVTKLDDIYCKYLLPYDTLSTGEREKLFEDVEKEWKKRETKALERLNDSTTSLSSLETSNNEDEDDEDSSDETEECIVKGRNMPLNAFYRIARNTQRMWFGENQRNNQNEMEGASSSEVEAAFWKHVSERKRHVCVHAASIDSSGRGFGFSVAKNSPFARHPWNLKVLTNNSGSVLRALGPLMGVTIPTIHVGMLFSACCWYRDPHGLPWIEYLHTGAKKIWYGIPNEYNDNFREALSKMVPRFCKNKTIWLPSDTAMVPPEMLVSNGVPLCRIVQEPGQFIIVFPKAFTSSICTGYVVSESVYFAQTLWLEHAEQIFKDLQDSCEPSMFSFEQLLFSIINDSRSHIDILKQILPVMMKIRERELHYRQQLEYYGLMKMEKLPLPDSGKRKKALKVKDDDGDFECETCRMNLFVSLVNNSMDDSAYCLPHALQLIARKKQVLKHCTLKYTYNEDELDDLIHKLEDRIEAKSKKKQSKQSC